MYPIRDFSTRNTVPGTQGGAFDGLVKFWELIERLPGSLFAVLLLALAVLAAGFRFGAVLLVWALFLGDWMLMAWLPRKRISFGPPKPPALTLVLLRLPFMLLPEPLNAGLQVLGTVLIIYAFWIEPQRLACTHESLHSNSFPAGASMRLLHLGDLHMERRTAREERILEFMRSSNPDVIVFTGDFLNYSYTCDPETWQELRLFLQELQAPGGVFAVYGSPPVDPEEVITRVLPANIHLLVDEAVPISVAGMNLDILGLRCSHRPDVDARCLQELIGKCNNFKLLLYHTPDLAPHAAQLGVDMQLSGHTHGGQVRLPFYGALYAASLYGKRFEAGRYQLDDMVLYVTRGVGLEGKGAPRVRFLCPPEVTLWEISGPESSGRENSGSEL